MTTAEAKVQMTEKGPFFPGTYIKAYMTLTGIEFSDVALDVDDGERTAHISRCQDRDFEGSSIYAWVDSQGSRTVLEI